MGVDRQKLSVSWRFSSAKSSNPYQSLDSGDEYRAMRTAFGTAFKKARKGSTPLTIHIKSQVEPPKPAVSAIYIIYYFFILMISLRLGLVVGKLLPRQKLTSHQRLMVCPPQFGRLLASFVSAMLGSAAVQSIQRSHAMSPMMVLTIS